MWRFTNMIFTRGMARRARRIMQNKKIEKVPQAHPALVDKISKGDKEITFGKQGEIEKVHHGESNTFESLNLREDVLKAMENMGVTNPTIIQMLCIPMIINKKNVFCAAQTGSGKTLVYAASIISKIKDESDDGFIKRLSRPRALIIAPSRELAMQILKVFKTMSHLAPIQSLGLIGQKQKKWTRDYLKGTVDVIVGTPNTVLKYHKTGRLLLSDLRYIVFDEADTLMDDNFREVTNSLLDSCEFSDMECRPGTQAIMTAATLPPKGVIGSYRKHIPGLEICQSNLHKVLPHIKHTFIKTTQNMKIDLLIGRLQNFLKRPTRKCVIFCNTSKASNFVSVKLEECNISHAKLHGNMNPKIRFENYDRYMNDELRVLVCTDVVSRGLDVTDITNVFNYDCPFNATDYLHRAGRTGRAKEQFPGEGQIVTYVTQNKEVLFARRIEDAAKRNRSLDNIRRKKNSPKQKYQLAFDKEQRLLKKRN